jgi:hypothetical protein
VSATVNGQQCSDAEATIPHYGVPWGRCSMAEAFDIPAIGTQILLDIASVPMLCTVIEAGERGGVTSLEFVGGYGGWRKPPPEAAGYVNGAGVSLAEAAVKLAAAVGETLIPNGAAARPLGSHLAVAGSDAAGPAGALLSQLCALPDGAERVRWHVDPAGVTRLGGRLPLPEIDATEIGRDDRGRWVAFAEESALFLLPGATFNGREIAELKITAKPDEIREVVTFVGDQPASAAAKFWKLISDIVRPWLLWRTLYTYRVTRVHASGLPDLVPVTSNVAPKLEAVRAWPGIGGNVTKPKVGAKCLVTFADGNPNAPVIVAWQPQLASADQRWRPTRTDQDADLIVLARGTRPAGQGGATASLLPLPPTGTIGNAALTITQPGGLSRTWTFSAPGLVVTPPVLPDTGVFTIDPGRPEVLV